MILLNPYNFFKNYYIQYNARRVSIKLQNLDNFVLKNAVDLEFDLNNIIIFTLIKNKYFIVFV